MYYIAIGSGLVISRYSKIKWFGLYKELQQYLRFSRITGMKSLPWKKKRPNVVLKVRSPGFCLFLAWFSFFPTVSTIHLTASDLVFDPYEIKFSLLAIQTIKLQLGKVVKVYKKNLLLCLRAASIPHVKPAKLKQLLPN